jgi:hypothetical protein
MFGGFGLITSTLLWFGAVIVVRCDRVTPRQVVETQETRDGVTVPVRRVVQEGRVDVTVEQRVLGVLPVRRERLADVLRAGVERKSGGVRGPAAPQLRLVLRDGRVWDSQPVRWAVGTTPREMAPRIQEFVDQSSVPSLRLWWTHWLIAALSVLFLSIFLLFLAAGVNMARQEFGLG